MISNRDCRCIGSRRHLEQREQVLRAATIAFLLSVLTGCGHSGPERAVVKGEVRYQEAPVPFGKILFVPDENTLAPTSGGFIVDGQYEVSAKGGVPVGTHKVEIRGYQHKNALSGGIHLDDASAPGPGDPEYVRSDKQFLPPKYNTKTELTITIEPNESLKIQDFLLE